MKHLKQTLSMGLMLASLHGALAQSQSVQLESTSDKEFRSINAQQVADEITAILAAQDLTAADVSALTTALNGLTWNDVLSNGATSSVDVSLGGNDLSNVARLLAQIIAADSLSVTKVIDGQIGSLANHSTDALSEGSTNQYFTLPRSRNAITLSDAGGDGSLTYNATTGAFTFTGPTAAEVRAHFSEGTGVEITDGAVSIGQSVGTADDVTFGSVTAVVTGDLTGDVTGTVSSLSNHTTDALTEGSNLYFSDARAQAAMSGGTGVTVTAGEIAVGQPVDPTSNVTFNSVTADLVGDVTGHVTGNVTGNLTGDVTGTVSSLSNHSTDELEEGSNLYFTDARAQAAMSGGTGVTVTAGAIAIGQPVEPTSNVTFNSVTADLVGDVTGNVMGNVTGNLTGDVTGSVSSLSNHTTDALAEGSNNLYMTTADRSAIQQMEHALDSLNCTWMKHRGHVYKLVLIEDQCWFAENLQSLVYANGDSILHNVSWWPNAASAGDGAAAVYNEGTPDEAMNLERYGRLYNWYAASDPRNICPNGWRVGQNEDWETLFINLGMTPTQATSGGWQGTDQGTRIKSSPTDSPDWNGSNTTGFSALPSGLRNRSNNGFGNEGVYSYWWSGSTDGDSPCDWRITSTVSGVNRTCNENPGWGFSIRCIRE